MENFKEVWDFNLINTTGGIQLSIGDLILVILLIYCGVLLSNLIGSLLVKKLTKSNVKPDLIIVIKRVVSYTILLLVAITAMSMLGIPITAFAFATGAIAIGVGFGAQNIINNFISGWILIAERPIKVNDFIEVDGHKGLVKNIGARSTMVHSSNGVHVLVPNSKLLENTVINWTLVDGIIRTSVRVGVAYGTDTNKVLHLIEQCVKSNKTVLNEPEPEFIFEDFGDNALIFDALFWCDIRTEKTLRTVRSEIRLAISNAFANEGIVIAFPQRDIHLHNSKPLEVKLNI